MGSRGLFNVGLYCPGTAYNIGAYACANVACKTLEDFEGSYHDLRVLGFGDVEGIRLGFCDWEFEGLRCKI